MGSRFSAEQTSRSGTASGSSSGAEGAWYLPPPSTSLPPTHPGALSQGSFPNTAQQRVPYPGGFGSGQARGEPLAQVNVR